MIFQWESEEERLRRFMRISPKNKLEWLRRMSEFLSKATTKRQKVMYGKLRETR